MNEFFLIHRGIGVVMCVVFPVLVGGIAIAYAVMSWRDRRRDGDKDR
jgi:hypothetical protein